MRRDAVVSAVLVITVLMNCFLFPYQQLLSVFAEQVLFVGPVGLGYMGAASGVGAVARCSSCLACAASGPRL